MDGALPLARARAVDPVLGPCPRAPSSPLLGGGCRLLDSYGGCRRCGDPAPSPPMSGGGGCGGSRGSFRRSSPLPALDADARFKADARQYLLRFAEEEQERLLTRGDFMNFPSIAQNMKVQKSRHLSLLDQRVHGSNRGPPRFVHRASNRGLLQVPVPRLRKRIATHLKNSNNTFAMLNTFNEVDMTNLMKLLFDYKDEIFKKHGFKLCTMSCFVMAVVSALQNQPTMNSVGTSKGLVVPISTGTAVYGSLISTGTAVYGSLISTDEAGKEER